MKNENTTYILEKIANIIIVFENGQTCRFDGTENFNLDIRQHDDSSLYFETYQYNPTLKENIDKKMDVSKVIVTYDIYKSPDNMGKLTHIYGVKTKEINMEVDISDDLGGIGLTIRGYFYAE